MRVALVVEYDGLNYHGFQYQKNVATIQEEIEKSIRQFTKEVLRVKAAGRTDAGVHAIEQSAHFECKKKILNLNKFLKSINYFVNDKDISIIDIRKRSSNFHARYSAKQRIYTYVILNRLSKPSIEKERGWQGQNCCKEYKRSNC